MVVERLTQDQAEKLRKAISQAQKFGGCKYVSEDKPCCVIAQLATLEGVPLEKLREWDEANSQSVLAIQPEELASYSFSRLSQIQNFWDGIGTVNEPMETRIDHARELMLAVVEEASGG